MRVALLTAAAVVVGAGLTMSAQAPEPKAARLDGAWGGNHAKVIAGAADVRVQIECLAGRLETAIPVGANGTFAVRMRLAPIRGVQIEGAVDDGPMAEVSGTIAKDTLQLTIGPPDIAGAGTYRLTRGGKAVLPNCRLRS